MKKLFLVAGILLFTAGLYAEVVVDDVGRKVNLRLPVGSVVCLSPGHTEMFYAIGADNVLTAVSLQCDYPEAAKAKTKAGTFQFPDVERIMKLKPDVIISAGGVQKDVIKKLEKSGAKVIVFYPKTVEMIKANLRMIGKLTGRQQQAEAEVRKIEAAIAPVKKPAKPLKVYAELWVAPSMAAGGDSYVNDIITLAGGQNIFASEKSDYPKINTEEVIKRNPDVIMLFYQPDPNYKKRVYYKNTTAGKKGNLYPLTKEEIDMVLRPGPRVAEAIKKINSYLLKAK